MLECRRLLNTSQSKFLLLNFSSTLSWKLKEPNFPDDGEKRRDMSPLSIPCLRRGPIMQFRSPQALAGLALAIVLTVFVLLHLHSDISRLEKAKIKIESAVARLQIENLEAARRRLNVLPLTSSPDNLVVIYNRVPKTASTSFVGVAYDLCRRNAFNVLHVNVTRNWHTLSLPDQVRFVYNVTNWTAKKPAIYHGHVAFLDFGRFAVAEKPVYINLIRRPLDRLVSYYYFLRNGDDFRPYLKRKRMGDRETFDDCVKKSGPDCAAENLWLQIPFFCGHEVDCWQPGNAWALEEAKRNLASKYLVVGVTEELDSFVQVLELTLPRFFKGASQLFASGKKSHLRKTANKLEPKPETVEAIQASDIWRMENEFYEFALEQFHYVKKKTLDIQRSELVENGQMFFYEKIRPK